MDVGQRPAPSNIWISTERAQTRARRVENDPVKHRPARRVARVETYNPRRPRVHRRQRIGERADATSRALPGNEEPSVGSGSRDHEGLTARRRTEIEDAVITADGYQLPNQLRGFILRPEEVIPSSGVVRGLPRVTMRVRGE